MIGMTQYITHMRYEFHDQFTLPPMMEFKQIQGTETSVGH